MYYKPNLVKQYIAVRYCNRIKDANNVIFVSHFRFCLHFEAETLETLAFGQTHFLHLQRSGSKPYHPLDMRLNVIRMSHSPQPQVRCSSARLASCVPLPSRRETAGKTGAVLSRTCGFNAFLPMLFHAPSALHFVPEG